LQPIEAERAEGVYVYDTNGKRYLDFSSQHMSVNTGHCHPEIIDAICKQTKKLGFVNPSIANEPRGLLAKKLVEITPGKLTKTFFTTGGSEAVENALKIARIYTGKYKIISHYRSYHGATMGAVSIGGDPRKFAVDQNATPNIVHVETPYLYRCPWGSKTEEESAQRAGDNLEQVIKYENPDSIAAIIIEGEIGTSGCLKMPTAYYKRIKQLANKYGFLVISDEVMSGFGRCGKMFGIQNHNIEPDIITMAKGLTSGSIPLGAMITTDTIANYFNDKPLPLGLTFSGHPVACATAYASINVIEKENLAQNATEMGKYLTQKIEILKAKHPSIGDYRTTGLLGCIELVKNRTTKEPLTPWNAKPTEMEATNRIIAKIKELGMITLVRWNWIFIAPPLVINKQQIDEGLNIISQAIAIADEYYKG
jgi:taurine--2-oxoglutarate transaminase